VTSLDLRGLEDLGGRTALDDRSVLHYHLPGITMDNLFLGGS